MHNCTCTTKALRWQNDYAETHRLDLQLLEDIADDLEHNCPYHGAYLHMQQLIRSQDLTSEVRLGFAADAGRDPRRYNAPTIREVAAIFGSSDGAPPGNRDIVVWPRDAAHYRINENNKHVDPMTYPLMFSKDPLAGPAT